MHTALNRRIAVGAGWMIMLRWLDRLIGLVSIAILARLLLPEDFGLVGYAMVFLAILELFFLFSFETALIRDQKAEADSYNTAWTLELIKGVVLSALLALGAKPAAAFFGEPQVETILYLIALFPILRGEEARHKTFSELVDTRGGTPNFPSRMIRSDRWKLWEYSDGLPPAMFDLEDDPEELRDLGTDPGHSGIRNTLLDELHADWDPAWSSARSVELDQDLAVLSAWGDAVRPKSPDTLAAPPPSIEEDVELL